MSVRFASAMSVLLLVIATAHAEEPASAAHYASGPLPPSFDTYVSRESKGYELNGAYYGFDGLAGALKKAGAKAVLVQGLATAEQIQCAAILGIDSGSSIFVVDKNGKAKALSWSADEDGAAKARAACREGR